MLTGWSTPTATEWLPFGCSTSHAVSLEPGVRLCSAWLSSRSDDTSRSKTREAWSCAAFESLVAGMNSMLPEIDGCGFRFPDPRIVYAGQFGQRAIFRAEGDILVGLGHHGGLAGDRIAHDAKTVLGADDEGEEAIEVRQRAFQRLAEVLA